MANPTYYTHSAPTASAGFLMMAESQLKIGTAALYGSLETSSWTYGTYKASIGLKAGASFDVGVVSSLGFNLGAEVNPLESVNVSGATVFMVTGETATISVGVQEIKPQTLEMAMATGVMYALGNERLITFGGGCSVKNRPISIDSANMACDAPTSPDVTSGISVVVVTFYDCICSSGLPWDSIVVGEMNSIDLEFSARPVLARSKGNRLGNVYIA